MGKKIESGKYATIAMNVWRLMCEPAVKRYMAMHKNPRILL